MNKISRCEWANGNELMARYHDTEYGFPVTDDQIIFERLMLEIYQAGLTWNLVLQKRKEFNKVFFNYNIQKVSEMTENDTVKLLDNPNIIRNKMKLNTTVHNAKNSLKIIKKYGSLFKYFSQLPYKYKKLNDLKVVVKQMKKDNFKFIGPLILEEFFLSIGLNKVKHSSICFLYKI